MISLVTLVDAEGLKHEIWLDGMEFRVDSTGQYDMKATITGRIVAAPPEKQPIGARVIVKESGQVVGTYRGDETWRPKG